MTSLCVCLPAALAVFALPAAAQPVLVDGQFDDWGTPAHQDAPGDHTGTLDLRRLWISNDADYLFLSVELDREVNLQEGSGLVLWLDTDDAPTTGEPIGGIGAEIVWRFGDREGTSYLVDTPGTIGHDDLGLFAAPTVTADRFEIALRRDATVAGHPLFQGPSVQIALRADAAGDALPDEGGVPYTFVPSGTREPVELGRDEEHTFRVLTYNVLRDGLFAPGNEFQHRRILAAIDPDVIALQEVYAHSAAEVAARLEELAPSPDGQEWHAAGVGSDVFAASRSPITASVPLCAVASIASTCNGAFRLDTRDALGAELDLVVAHPPCCWRDAYRQEEVDHLMAHLRDARASGALSAEVPVILAGDFNLVGDARQLETLLTGDIVDESRFGPDAAPDVDGTALAAVDAVTTGRPAVFTWTNAAETFWPGRLDYILYSDALLDLGNAFVLFTPGLTVADLSRSGLAAADTEVSDHLPLVADFALRAPTASEAEPGASRLSPPTPNPTSGAVSFSYRLARGGPVSLIVVDALGRTVATVEDSVRPAGDHTATLPAGLLAPGAYLVRLRSSDGVEARRLTVVR